LAPRRAAGKALQRPLDSGRLAKASLFAPRIVRANLIHRLGPLAASMPIASAFDRAAAEIPSEKA